MFDQFQHVLNLLLPFYHDPEVADRRLSLSHLLSNGDLSHHPEKFPWLNMVLRNDNKILSGSGKSIQKLQNLGMLSRNLRTVHREFLSGCWYDTDNYISYKSLPEWFASNTRETFLPIQLYRDDKHYRWTFERINPRIAIKNMKDLLEIIGCGTLSLVPHPIISEMVAEFKTALVGVVSEYKLALVISHNWSGGSRLYEQRIYDYLPEWQFLCIRIDPDEQLFSCFLADELVGNDSYKLELLPDLLFTLTKDKQIHFSILHIHHVFPIVGQSFYRSVVDCIVEHQIPIMITIHDLQCITGEIQTTETMIHKSNNDNNNNDKNNYLYLFERATWLVCPSRATRTALVHIFPTICQKLWTAWHEEVEPPSSTINTKIKNDQSIQYSQPFRIAVVGAMHLGKWPEVVFQVIQELVRFNLEHLIEIHWFGEFLLPPDTQLPKELVFHDKYENAELCSLLQKQQIELVWFPTRTPETFCYALSEVIRSGLPILAPGIGAFPERLQGYLKVVCHQPDVSIADLINIFYLFRDQLRHQSKVKNIQALDLPEMLRVLAPWAIASPDTIPSEVPMMTFEETIEQSYGR